MEDKQNLTEQQKILLSKLETLRAEMHRSVDARVDRSIQHILTSSEPDQIIDRFCFRSRKHRLCVPNLCQCFKCFAGDMLCGRIGQDHTAILLQRDQIVNQAVIFQIAHDWRVMLIVGGIRLPDLLDQLLHSFINRFVHSVWFTPCVV